MLSTKDDIEYYIEAFISQKYKAAQAAKSLPRLSYVAGMAHMLDLMCECESEAEKIARELKDNIAKVITEILTDKTQELIKQL